jgi:thiol-disulfide isomerase/thioredoxin
MGSENSSNAQRLRNFAIAIVAIVLVAALSVGLRNQNATSLEAQAAKSQPIDVALSNGKPTLMEFYANWCTSCQAMAQDLAEIKQKFGETVNFSMLNVDNTKWLPEISKYRVDGIPHFVFFNRQAEVVAQAIGEQPRSILENNLTALVSGKALPNAPAIGELSQFVPKTIPRNDAPRAHGA